MHRGLTGSVVAAILLTGCTAATKTQVPDYRLESGDKPTDLRVVIDRLYPADEMTAIITDLQRRYADQDNGYFVRINCSSGGTRSVDNRLANGKFAVGSIGGLRTGLKAGAYELTPVAGAQCPPAPLPAAAPGAITVDEVVAKFRAAGLPVVDPRDNTYGMCPDVGCTKLLTTEKVSVYQFPDAEAAARWKTTPLASYRNGAIVLLFWDESDSAKHLVADYRQALDEVMSAH
ncbi:Uncharacterised protein [Mycobacteroides abscessus subsp. bolletii]|uniref:hypothetical protein n=1 Tax=Mycobacteroides abscessus TaxID=36809 RepID=UPI00092A39BC|nr:hypothetical protein [Mycobacteroides abscessus]SIJ38966.1 Uncharacterised protein [Mycobacteroides abscessus subsp. bolletii]SLE27277.1 Uncharacterised protein [Mycobacteroides abscessus subsp. bolletii]SLF14561.1 Uncharacterised protein [Mycobacteroides abscessus subsp. bolletii]